MSKTCQKCFYRTDDDTTVFCPACGSVFDGAETPAKENAAPKQTDARYAQPVNAGVRSRYAQPVQSRTAAPSQPVTAQPPTAPKPAKAKKRLPYILLGFFAAAAIFTVALIIILSSGSKLAGSYTWTNGADGATGSLTITESKSGTTGYFIYDGKGSVTLSFDTKKETVSYPGSDGSTINGTYRLDGDDLTITSDGYTDTFKRK